LQQAWQAKTRETVDGQTSLVRESGSTPQSAFYVAEQPLEEGQSVSQFAVGPTTLMREAAEASGARAPLLPQLEKLWNATDQQSDIVVLLSTPFLFTEGRGLVTDWPERLRGQLKPWLGGNIRAASLHLRWQPQCYLETRVVGTNDLETSKIMTRQQQRISQLPSDIEHWLVRQPAHPYWRGLALRYPQMLRARVQHTRFGVEQGTALFNSYLPTTAAANVLLSSWIALQEQSTLPADATSSLAADDEPESLSIEAYLDRPIRLSFDQEPIEVALSLVGEEANAQLPAGTPALRFSLDGDAFEKAGITRNQQLRSFRIDQQPVRQALTQIASMGNPVTTVTDLHQAEQSLIWVVKPDPEHAPHMMISLTTRAAAAAEGVALPAEFVTGS